MNAQSTKRLMDACRRNSLASFLLSVIMFAANQHHASAVKTVVATRQRCEARKNFKLDDQLHTYRVIMPDIFPPCSQDFRMYFICQLDFKLRQSASSRQQSDDRQICVDFARLHLNGSYGTSFSLNTGSSSDDFTLSPSRVKTYQSHDRSSWVKCFSSHKTVSLTFKSYCNHGHSLRYYFPSWVYVYLQPSDKDPVFHVDGKCSQTEEIPKDITQFTIRSYLWLDSFKNYQNKERGCFFRISPKEPLGADVRAKLCPQWNVKQNPCPLSAILREPFKDQVQGLECLYGGYQVYTNLNDCLEFSFDRQPELAVQSTKNVLALYKINDGALFFEMKVTIKFENPDHGDVDDFSLGDEDDDGDGDDDDSDSDDKIFLKVFIPIAAVLGICCCLCGINKHKKSEDLEPEDEANYGDGIFQHSESMESISQAENVAMEPLMPSDDSPFVASQPYSANSHHFGVTIHNDGEGSGGDGLAAPPPSYADVRVVTPSAPPPPESSPVPSGHRSPAWESASSAPPPPPPISSVPVHPPPAYDELFPS